MAAGLFLGFILGYGVLWLTTYLQAPPPQVEPLAPPPIVEPLEPPNDA